MGWVGWQGQEMLEQSLLCRPMLLASPSIQGSQAEPSQFLAQIILKGPPPPHPAPTCRRPSLKAASHWLLDPPHFQEVVKDQLLVPKRE